MPMIRCPGCGKEFFLDTNVYTDYDGQYGCPIRRCRLRIKVEKRVLKGIWFIGPQE